MSKFIKIFVLGLVFLTSVSVFPESVDALCDGGETGPKLGNRTDFLGGGAYPDNFIRSKYDDHNERCRGDGVAVTVLFTFDQVKNEDPSVLGLLNQMHSQRLYPIIRLYTAYTGSGFQTIDANEAAEAAKGLASLVSDSNWNADEVIVYPGNEVNSPAEWPDPASGLDIGAQKLRIASFAQIYASFSKNNDNQFQVYLPPLNAYLGKCLVTEGWSYPELFGHFVQSVRGAGGIINGAAFTVYNNSPDTIRGDIATMASVAANNGVGKYMVSEVGPKRSPDDPLGCRLYDQENDVDAWKQHMSEVFKRVYSDGYSSIFLNAERATTSFFLNCNNQLTSFLVVIGQEGDVSIEEEDKISCSFVPSVGDRPIDRGFHLNPNSTVKFPCEPGYKTPPNITDPGPFQITDDEFHPLRPYPASSCDPLIPQSEPEAPFLLMEKPSGSQNLVQEHKYINYACGTSVDFTGTETFNPWGYTESGDGLSEQTGSVGQYAGTVCNPATYSCTPDQYAAGQCPTLTCYRTLRYELEVDFRDSNLGILGNTQTDYQDEEMVNNYLSWYFSGTLLEEDYAPLDSRERDDIYKLINYSGPVRKLMPFDAQNFIRSTIATAQPNDGISTDPDDIHDYIVGCKREIDLNYIRSNLEAFIQLIKDTAGLGMQVGNFVLFVTSYGIDNLFELGTVLIEMSQQPDIMASPNEITQYLFDKLTQRGFIDDLLIGSFSQALHELHQSGANFVSAIGTVLRNLALDIAVSCNTSDDIKRLSSFENTLYPNGNLPPDPRDYIDFDDFWEVYIRWRGQTNLPFFGPVDIPNPFVNQSHWAQLLQNIQFAGNEDIPGEGFFTGYGQGVGPYGSTDGRFTASPQFNIIEAEPAQP